MKNTTIAIFVWIISPIIIWYFSKLDTVALWIYAWMPAFLYLILAKSHSPFIRGLVLIGWTIAISAIGSDYLVKSHPELESAITMIIAMLGMISGGVGGNFMAHELLHLENQPKSNKKK